MKTKLIAFLLLSTALAAQVQVTKSVQVGGIVNYPVVGPPGPAGTTTATGTNGSFDVPGQLTSGNITSTTQASSYVALGDSITCGYISGATPFTPANGTSCSPNFAYPSIIASDTATALTNAGFPGDQACDLWFRDVAGFRLSPSLSAKSLSSILIGSNDSNHSGAGAYLTTFGQCYSAVLAWMAMPAEAKALPSSATLGSGWSLTSSTTVGSYITSSTSAATASFSVNSYGGPLMIWYVFSDAGTGIFTYSIDGGTPITVTAQAVPAMSTQAGTTTSVSLVTGAVMSGTPTAPVAHTITIRNVSGTASIVGAGSPMGSRFYSHPVVATSDVPNVAVGGPLNYSIANQFGTLIRTISATFVGYGMDVRFGSNRGYLGTSAAEFQVDKQHPTHLGAVHLSQAFEQLLQITPVSRVLTSSFTSGSLPTTVGSVLKGIPNADSTAGTAIAMGDPLPGGFLNSFQLNFLDDQSGTPLNIYIFDRSGSTISIAHQFTVTPSGAKGVQTFTAGVDFTTVGVTAGELIGYYSPNPGPSYIAPAIDSQRFYFFVGSPPSSATWTLSNASNGTLLMTAIVGGKIIGNVNKGMPNSDSTAGTAIAFPTPLPAGVLNSFQLNFMDNQSATPLTVYIFNQSGTTLSIASQFTVNPSGAIGIQTFLGGVDYTSFSVTAGQLIGYYSPNPGPSYIKPAIDSDRFYYYIGSPPSSTTWTLSTAPQGTLLMSATVGGTTSGGTVTLTGMTPQGHCGGLTATNALAATNLTTTYVSYKTYDSINITAGGPFGMTYDLACTPY